MKALWDVYPIGALLKLECAYEFPGFSLKTQADSGGLECSPRVLILTSSSVIDALASDQ